MDERLLSEPLHEHRIRARSVRSYRKGLQTPPNPDDYVDPGLPERHGEQANGELREADRRGRSGWRHLRKGAPDRRRAGSGAEDVRHYASVRLHEVGPRDERAVGALERRANPL